jgi:hypothetical protein
VTPARSSREFRRRGRCTTSRAGSRRC